MGSNRETSSSDDFLDEEDLQPPTRVVPKKDHDDSDDLILDEQDSFSHIGRYRIISQLGKGGFGLVFRAHDPELKCDVAIKIPRFDRVMRDGELERFRNEARTLARIRNHPSIVTVYDVGQTDEGVVYAVMEFVEGESLSSFLASHELTVEESLEILLKIADGLTIAHQASIVHRDLKPSNVILDKHRNITLVDFGLALHDDISLAELGTSIEGTPRYMAPEQIRGENHRIDGQTDIWAFGIIMYRMLTGKHPFQGKGTRELAQVIRYKEARPLRQLNPDVPKEVERICLKCLSKNMSDRYLSVPDLMDDVGEAISEMQAPTRTASLNSTGGMPEVYQNSHQSPSSSDSQRTAPSGRTGPSAGTGLSAITDSSRNPLQITYKGLRPFDSNDSDFFLHLLPGPKTRDGVPESIQFWRSRICGDELEPLDVGLIYGPSGCGKSSFVRAGLLPVLPVNVIPVYLECSLENSEQRLAQQIAHRIHTVDGNDSLSNILRQIRRGTHLDPDDKLMIVLDQFEQWLHGNNEQGREELTEALRQCDGEKISCLLLIRDDYWMSMSGFMKSLDILIREGNNALALPLFDERHARKVLVAYGRSFDRLPQSTDEQGTSLNAQQSRFVRDAVKSLSQNGKVICVHLSVFAQIARDREWTANELQRLGGLKGVGVRFLDDLFPSRSGSKFRNEQDEIVKSIFRELLPGKSTLIKGTSRTREQLWRGLDGKYSRQTLDQMLERLQTELRLISGVDTDEQDDGSNGAIDETGDRFRLTHDFLVTPIREWLDRRQKETRSGRTTQRLTELGEAWDSTKDPCYLPGLLEYTNFLMFASGQSKAQFRDLLAVAGRRETRRLGIVAMIVVAVSLLVGYLVNDGFEKSAKRHVDNYLVASPENSAFNADALDYWQWRAKPQLESELESDSIIRRLRASSFLIDQFVANPAYVDVFCEALKRAPESEYRNSLSTIGNLDDDTIRNFIAWVNQLQDEQRRVKFALIFVNSGYPELAEKVLDRRNSYGRSYFIKSFPDSAWNVERVCEQLKTYSNSDLQSGLCLGLAAYWEKNGYGSKEVQPGYSTTLFQSLFNGEHSSGGVRSAAEYALRSAGESPDYRDLENKHDEGWKSIKLADLEWATFVRIPGSTFDPMEGLTEELILQNRIDKNTIIDGGNAVVDPYYLCSIPVTRSLFRYFIDQLPDIHELKSHAIVNDSKAEDNQFPAAGIKWHHAVEFCNWMSREHGLPAYYRLDPVSEDQLAELRKALPETMILENRWNVIERDGPGFRLPFVLEWQLAYRAQTATTTPFSNSLKEPFWDLYTSFRNSTPANSRFGRIHARMPNQFGLFDMAGNTSQWCNDVFEEFFNKRCGGHNRSNEDGLFAGVFQYTAQDESWKIESIRLAVNPGPDGNFPESKKNRWTPGESTGSE